MSSTAAAAATTTSWQYVDMSGQLQGPFTSSMMRAWHVAGCFPKGFEVSPIGEDKWRPIETVREICFDNEVNVSAVSAVPAKGGEDQAIAIDDLFAGLSLEAKKSSSSSSSSKTKKSTKKSTNQDAASEAGRQAWHSFQSKQRPKPRSCETSGTEKDESDEANGPGANTRVPLSFKLAATTGGNRSRSGRKKQHATSHGVASAAALSSVACTASTANGSLPSSAANAPEASSSSLPSSSSLTTPRRRKRLLYAVVDTSSWIDEAFNLSLPAKNHRPHRHQQQRQRLQGGPSERQQPAIDERAFLQGLATTEVKIVLPVQVVRELDGLKDQREKGGQASGGSGKSHAQQPPPPPPPQQQPPPLSDTAVRARRVIAVLRDAQRMGGAASSFIVPEIGGAGGGEPSTRDDSFSSSSSSSSRNEGMAADRRILACALRMRSRLRASGEYGDGGGGGGGAPEKNNGAGFSGSAGPRPPPPRTEVVLVTSDVNLQLLAGIGGGDDDDGGGGETAPTIPLPPPPAPSALALSPATALATQQSEPLRAMAMGELRRELAEREEVWRRAYRKDFAERAIDSAVLMSSSSNAAQDWEQNQNLTA